MDNNKHGFSLIEVLCAIGITIPMMVLIMQIVPSMARVTQQTKSTMISSHLSASYMEEISRQVQASANAMSLNYSESGQAYAAPYVGYIRNVTDSLDPNVKTVTVEVWRDLNADSLYDSDEPGFTTITNITKY